MDFFTSVQPQCDELTEFCDYLTDNYITPDARFPPRIWAEKSAAPTKTTNACESFHSRYNSTFYKTHPDLYSFVGVLKQVFKDSKILINSANKSEATLQSKTLKKMKAIQASITKLFGDSSGDSLSKFICAVSHKNTPNMFL